MLRSFMTGFVIVVSVFVSNSCANVYKMYADAPHDVRTVRLWLQKSEDLPRKATLEGCEFWKPEGVQCSIVEDADQASIRISLDPRPCKSDIIFAIAHSRNDGTIALYSDCMRVRGTMDPNVYRATIAHEIGHQLGIWCHIPASQGGALMNPLVHEELRGITTLDHEAYAIRDQLVRAPGDSEQSCVVRTKK
jgi:Zn-dependent protease with chaperone function